MVVGAAGKPLNESRDQNPWHEDLDCREDSELLGVPSWGLVGAYWAYTGAFIGDVNWTYWVG